MNVFWLYATVILMGFSVQAQFNPTCNSNDSMVLKHFMNQMESRIDGWTSNSSNCCDWDGITCDSSGKVIKLELSKKKLVGDLVDSLTDLDQLRTLNLSRNLLKGIPPISIFHLPHLQVLDLSANEFSGSFLDSVNLPSIQLFDVSDNNFEGSIPSGLCVNSTGIRVLKLGVNYFTGDIPPEFKDCSFLEHLCLDGNFVSGIIPEYLFRLPRLLKLSVQDNALIGQLRNSNLSNLVYLDVSLNYISGNLPDFFHLFPNLTYFAAHSNNLDGRIPLSLVNSRTISSLILRNNSFSGLIDLNCSAMVNLVSLDLADNKFTGSIPDILSSCPSLKIIDLGGNSLTGQVPESFKGFKSLSYLSLSMCNLSNLSGSLQILHTCPNLMTLVLSRSFDSEEMPYDANLQFKMLKTLVIPSCRLTGMIPLWLNGLTKLKILDLSWNELTGSIPPFLGSLQSLVYLDLSNNFINGEIPKSLTQLPDLRFHENSSELSVEFPIFMRRGTNGNGKALRYSYGIRFPPTLDLSNNFLTGPIWPEFGNLINLHVLNLKYNELSGNIPSNLGNLTSIETLDLSHNDLTGEIPLSLTRLGMLSKFSVAYNNLTGMIPSGGQFSTFSVSSFEGNPGLCGEFVLSCVKKQESLQIEELEVLEESIISLPVWTGFGTGFLFERDIPSWFTDKTLSTDIKRTVKNIPKYASAEFYINNVLPRLKEKRIMALKPFVDRLGYDNVPQEINRLRCRVNYHALKFLPKIDKMSDQLVARMRNRTGSINPFMALHLRFEKGMVGLSFCDFVGTRTEKALMELYRLKQWPDRYKDGSHLWPLALWKRKQGRCPLEPGEVAVMLRAMGYTKETQIYVASGQVYGSQNRMASLRNMFPNLVTKEDLTTKKELDRFRKHVTSLAALDFLVCLKSDVFVMTHGGNFAKLIIGARRYMGHRQVSIKPDKGMLAKSLGDPYMGWATFVEDVVTTHQTRTGLPEATFPKYDIWENPLTPCMCKA